MPTITRLEIINSSGSTIKKDKAVYISGYNRNVELPEVDLADNRDEDTMPAIGITIEDIPNNTSSKILTSGYLVDINLSKNKGNRRVYIGTDGDLVYENPQDDDSTAIYQVIGIVIDRSKRGRILIAPISESIPALDTTISPFGVVV